ncbi:MAG: restriction endonuclease subunit S [Bacteroidota bacterium]
MVTDKTSVKNYPAYKDSGVEWSGLVPENWGALPIRAIFEERNEKNEGRKTDYILSVTKDRGVIPYDEKGAIGNNKSEDIERYKLVYPNDFVINKMNVVIGSLGMSKYYGAFSQVYLVYKPRTSQININYYSYIFSNPSFYKSLIKYCTGIMELRESLNKEDFKKIILPFPDYQTQSVIVEYLDRKTALIDQAISIKEKQIELLKERRQILIHKSVTRGLKTNIKLKDSGVEWIGEIPEDWEVKPLRFIGKTQNGLSKGGEYFGTGFPFLTYGDVYNDIELPNQLSGLAESNSKDQKQFSVQEGDVFFTRTSETVDEIGFASTCLHTIDQATFAGFLIRFRPKKNVLFKGYSKFYFSSKTHRSFFVGEMNLVIRASLSQELLKRLPVVIPPMKEQIEIAEYIETFSTKIITAITLKVREIEKLKEYKASLINSAVTGKIKV